MKRILTSLAMAALMTGSLWAANKTTSVSQVAEAITITDDVDYVITGNTPFAETGSVNIENTDHAVLIIQNIKPSLVLSRGLLNNIYIKGEKAVDGENCQVRMYAYGTIILPYDKSIKPLTVYSEQQCTGESCNAFGLENSGGYMNTLSAAKLNNRVRSFVLKRGYMVTFAIGQSGWGYSRCFIADTEDLVLNTLPTILDQRISSYRIFKWHYAQKKGLASNGDKGTNAQLNTSWCYDWAQGNASNLPDQEWVPNHIYEDYPSSATIGGVTGSCHTKNNNEPANNSDDHPQSVKTVLDNWQNMMRTGLRLCSPATHDGGWGWHNEFMNEIDARGWRCDIVDFHGYWSGQWNSLDWYIDTYAHGRPVWFSEWLWGASWNKDGIFNPSNNLDTGTWTDDKGNVHTYYTFSEKNQGICYNGTKPILDRLNANNRVERYAYWNGEQDASRLVMNGTLSKLGEYYASMRTPMAYNKAQEFVPKAPTVTAVENLACDYDRKKNIVKLSWTEAYGDLVTSITLQRKSPGSSLWKDLYSFTPRDQSSKTGSTYSAADTLVGAEPGEYEYRVKDVTYNKKTLNSNSVSIAIASQYEVGNFIFGSVKVPVALDLNNTATTSIITDIPAQSAAPLVFLGLPTYKNRAIGVTSFLYNVSKTQFKFGAMPWTNGFSSSSYDNTETMDYLVVPSGTYQYDNMQIVVGTKSSVKDTDVEVKFETPFPEGDSVVVICQPFMSATLSKYGAVARVTDVTNKGFKVRQIVQKDQKISARSMYYIAVSKGQAKIGDGYILSAGTSDGPVGGTAATGCAVMFDRYTTAEDATLKHDTLQLSSPVILCASQTDRLPEVASTFRIVSNVTKANVAAADGTTYTATTGVKVIRQLDASATKPATNTAKANGDTMGWICLSLDTNADIEDAIVSPRTVTDGAYYTISGVRLTQKPASKGIYIHNGRKVVVR